MPAETYVSMPQARELYDEQFARVLAGAGAAEIVDAVVDRCAEVTAVLVVDGDDNEVVRSPLDSMVDPRRDRWVLDVVALGRRTAEPVIVPRGEWNAVFHPAIVADRYVGGLLVLVPGAVGNGLIGALRRYAGLCALVAARDLAMLQPGGTVEVPVLRDLLTHHGDVDPGLRARAERAGIDFAARWIVAVVGPSSGADLRTVRTAIGTGCGVDFVSLFGGASVVLSRSDDAASTAEEVAEVIRRGTGTEALVCAAPADDLASGGLVRAYEAVASAYHVLRAAGRRCGAVDVTTLPAYVPLLDSVRPSDISGFVDSTLGPLRAFDDATSSALLDTLRVFFEENMNTAAAARRLGLHPNSVTKRLRRVSELLGGEWGDGASSVSLRLALSIDALATAHPT